MNKVTARVATAGLVAAILATGGVSGRSAEPIVGHIYTLSVAFGVVRFSSIRPDRVFTQLRFSPAGPIQDDKHLTAFRR
jgi:hypothetical protein